MKTRILIAVVVVGSIVLAGCNFGHNAKLEDKNRDDTAKSMKKAGGTDDAQ